MGISKSGDFSVDILAKELVRGLRPSKLIARDTKYLTECTGAVGRDGVLKTLEDLDRLDLDILAASFPYPQIFVLSSVTIICTNTEIYEYVNDSLVLKMTVPAGVTWTLVDFFNYVYMSNNVVAVVRDGLSMTYDYSDHLSPTQATCDFNGQVIISTLGLPGEGPPQ